MPLSFDGGELCLIPVGIRSTKMCLFDASENGAMPSQVSMKDPNSHGHEPSQGTMQSNNSLKILKLATSQGVMTMQGIDYGTMPSQGSMQRDYVNAMIWKYMLCQLAAMRPSSFSEVRIPRKESHRG